jgi:hypothetical protein
LLVVVLEVEMLEEAVVLVDIVHPWAHRVAVLLLKGTIRFQHHLR